MTPLHLAVKRNNPNIVCILLSDDHVHQADPNLVNRNGQTPLHMAATVGYVEVIRFLLQADLEEPCNPTIVDSQQLTAYQIAKANHHDTCAKLIDEYQQGWTKLSPRRDITESIHEQEINPVIMNPSHRLDGEQDETSDDSSSSRSSQTSKSSSEQRERSLNQWSTANGTKQETRTLADMIKNNPLQPETTKPNVSTPTNQTLANMMQNIPLQRDASITNTSKPDSTNQTLASMIQRIPLQRDTPITNVSKPNNQTIGSMINNIPLQTNDISTNKPITRKFRYLFCLFFNVNHVFI